MLGRIPLRLQLVAGFMLVSCLALLAAGAVLFVSEQARSRESLGTELRSLAVLLGDRSSAALLFLDEKTARENLDAVSGLPHLGSACLFDDQGQVFAGYLRNDGSSRRCTAVLPLQDSHAGHQDGIVHVQMPIRSGGNFIGAIQLISTRAPLDERLRALSRTLALALGGALLLSLLLTLLLQRVITGPLAQIRDVANAIIRSQDYGLRAPDLGRQELGQLAAAFNGMLGTIQSQNAALAALNRQLDERVHERTLALEEAALRLQQALDELRRTQGELVRAETLAGLGAIVAAVAHELNTPLGNCIGAASTLADNAEQFSRRMEDGALRRSQLEEFVATTRAASELLLRGLTRSAELVSNFKQVAVDQGNAQRRPFELRQVVDNVVALLNTSLRKTPYRIELDVPEGIAMESFPGALEQIIANLINNSVLHGFHERDHGLIRLSARVEGDQVRIEYRDDGLGMSEHVRRHVFDPFFTTRLGTGGSGLGMNISYNLATGPLGGSIEVASEVGQGCCFTLRLPLRAPMMAPRAGLPA